MNSMYMVTYTLAGIMAENEGDITFLAVFHNFPFVLKRSLTSLLSVKSSKRGYIVIHKIMEIVS